MAKSLIIFRQLFDVESRSYTYLLIDAPSKQAVLIDPVLEQLHRDTQLLNQYGATLVCSLETHVHADHITASGKLRELTNCQTMVPIGANVACANEFIADGQCIKIGNIELIAIQTLGHTDSHMAYYCPALNCVMTGDSLLIGGCGRTDFQGGSALLMHQSLQKICTLPKQTIIYPGHDYQGHQLSTIEHEQTFNPRLQLNQQAFIECMQTLNLPEPKKMMAALPANLACGKVII